MGSNHPEAFQARMTELELLRISKMLNQKDETLNNRFVRGDKKDSRTELISAEHDYRYFFTVENVTLLTKLDHLTTHC